MEVGYEAPAAWADCDWENPAADSAAVVDCLRQAVAERCSVIGYAIPQEGEDVGGHGAPPGFATFAWLAETVVDLYGRATPRLARRRFLVPDDPFVSSASGSLVENRVTPHDISTVEGRDFLSAMPGRGQPHPDWTQFLIRLRNAIDWLHVVPCGVVGDLWHFQTTSTGQRSANEACTQTRAAADAGYAAYAPSHGYVPPRITTRLYVQRGTDTVYGDAFSATTEIEVVDVLGASGSWPEFNAGIGYVYSCHRLWRFVDYEFANRTWQEGSGHGVLGTLDPSVHKLDDFARIGNRVQLPSINTDPSDYAAKGSVTELSFYLDFAVSGGFRFQTIQGE